jgi:ppGpp synthetase/RelA/SpoT-type nucleotidyltranferase
LPSKTRVNWAGDIMRQWMIDGVRPSDVHLRQALTAITAFREAHARPLQKVAVNLRYYVACNTQSRPIVVAQRLKRLVTILDKLGRQPEMKLARMHDIGGCRAVVASETQIRAVVEHLRRQRKWDIRREYDYIAYPKEDSGYRAYHLVVEKDGHLIEVQLRTERQHSWAELIESVDRRGSQFSLKGGNAPADITEYYRLGAALLASVDADTVPDTETLRRFRALHQQLQQGIDSDTRTV